MSGVRKPALRHALRLRCPLCGGAPIFRGWIRLHERCNSCGWVFAREPGYFLGSIYLNYGLTTMLTAGVWAALHYAAGLDFTLALALAGAFVVLFPLWFLRYARALWIWIDLSFDAPDSPNDPE